MHSRYGNIWPYDDNRVKLKIKSGGDDYINASWINNGGTVKFIAAQGPLPTTVVEFLRMIAENKVTTVVMLTKVMEKDADGEDYICSFSFHMYRYILYIFYICMELQICVQFVCIHL